MTQSSLHTPEEHNVKVEFWKLKHKFRDAAKLQYPGALYPEVAWVFDQVLKIDPRNVVQEPITKKSYLVFATDAHGNRVVDPATHKIVRVRRQFTPEQRKLVREWWALLPQDMLDG